MIGGRRGAPRDHLLIPIAPTTNGRLHLGHIGGPILKLDVMARHLARSGDHARLVSSTDPYDSYVLLRGRDSGQAPRQVVEYWHPLIERDLNAVGIAPELFVNLDDEPWRKRYHQISQGIIRDLLSLGLAFKLRERFPYCEANSQYITGGFLLSECPDCGTSTAGYFCEECALHFRPEDLTTARCGLDGCIPDWRDVTCLHVRLPDPGAVLRRMATMGIPDEFRVIIQTYLRHQGPTLRLTQPGTWGVPWPAEGSQAPQVTFTYVVGGLAFWLLCAEIGSDGGSALSGGSAIRTIASFGFDNSLPFLLGGLGIPMAIPGLKPPDHVLLNHFMTLEGSKFSTSRGHVIWAGDLASRPDAGSDAVRAYLTRRSPDRVSTDFSLADFTAFRGKVLRGQWRDAVASAWQHTPEDSALPGQLAERLNGLLAAQEQALDPADHDMPAVMDTLQSWVDETVAPADAPWWLRGLALLAFPVLPKFTTSLWQALGMSGTPDIERFLEPAAGPRASQPPVIGESTCATL